jgi:putative ABC transport system permease protein
VLWRPLPYPAGDRLVTVERLNSRNASGVAWPDFQDWREQSRGFDGLAGWHEEEATFGFGAGAELREGAAVSRELFEVLGLAPMLGRTFTEEEDRLGGIDAIVLSYGLWQERFGGDRAILGNASSWKIGPSRLWA